MVYIVNIFNICNNFFTKQNINTCKAIKNTTTNNLWLVSFIFLVFKIKKLFFCIFLLSFISKVCSVCSKVVWRTFQGFKLLNSEKLFKILLIMNTMHLRVYEFVCLLFYLCILEGMLCVVLSQNSKDRPKGPLWGP